MSRSLSRIRHLVSEIEEIQRQGQQVGRSALERTVNLKPIPETPKSVVINQAVPETVTQGVVPPVPPVFHVPEEDPFESLNTVVDFSPVQKEKAVEEKPKESGRVSMQLSSQIVLSLQMENSDECVELKQNADTIEIRFSDGKAVHLPLKTVA